MSNQNKQTNTKIMETTCCISCQEKNHGMISIHKHPARLDEMFESVTGIQVNPADFLCINCYDTLKVANSFKERCLNAYKNRTAEEIVDDEEQSIHEEVVIEELIYVEKTSASSEDVEEESKTEEVPKAEDKPPDNQPTLIDGRYKCPYPHCERTCKQKPAMTSHIRIHTKERPFACKECGKAFAENGNLKQHIRSIHFNERPFKCSNCGKELKTHYSHKVHQRSCFLNEKPFKCQLCDAAFISSGKLLLHTRKHTGDRPYKCVDCAYAFVDRASLKRHSMRRHGIEI